jgi:hypothetical protein
VWSQDTRRLAVVLASGALIALGALTAASAQADKRLERGSGGPGAQSLDCNLGTFTSGSGENLFSFCVSDHGNVNLLTTPAGFRHLDPAYNGFGFTEGYILCDDLLHAYIDLGLQEFSFAGTTIVTQPGGPGTLPLTIDRDTSDGKYTLRQSYAFSTTRKALVITERVFNHDTARRTLRIERFGDFGIDNNPADDTGLATADSAGQLNPDSGHGVFLTTEHPNYSAVHETSIDQFNPSVNVCSHQHNATPTAAGDWISRFAFPGRGINPGNSSTLIFVYQRE